MNSLLNYGVQLRCHLVPVLGPRRLDQLQPSDITAVKRAMADKAPATLAESLKTLRCLLNRAVREGVISTTPPFDVPRRIRKMPIAYSEQEQAALLAAAQELGPRYIAMILLGIDGGLRLGELLGLQWSDIDFGQASMVIRHNIVRGKLDVPKGKTEDEVGLTGRLIQALQALPRDGVFVFSQEDGTHFFERHLRAWMEQIVRKAGVPWRGIHVLRRTCGTRIADGGGGVAAVATHLRHKDLHTASRYIDRRGASSRALHALETSWRRGSDRS